jgi:CBS domain-containing protein
MRNGWVIKGLFKCLECLNELKSNGQLGILKNNPREIGWFGQGDTMLTTARHLLEVKGQDIWSIPPNATVFDAIRMMADKGVGALMVMEGDHMVGIISERDYARKVILVGKASRDTLVKEIMTSTVYSIHPDQTVEEAMEIMTNRHIRHLPVVVEDHVIGMISIGDVVKNIIYRQRETIRKLTT